MNDEKKHPFAGVCQEILNGKPFFDITKTEGRRLKKFRDFYAENCLGYKGCQRRGDEHLREVFKSLAFVVLGKFGEEALDEFSGALYRIVYEERLKRTRIDCKTAATFAEKVFTMIAEAKEKTDLRKIDEMTYKTFEIRFWGGGSGSIIKALARNADKERPYALETYIADFGCTRWNGQGKMIC